MSVPGNINTAPPPSSFDDNADFYSESRGQKLLRRLKEEPLIPLGCALTTWALWEATRSIRSGDKNRTNRMFRRRIYAQGFTILAMVVGSTYWESDRQKRNQYDELIEDKKKKEKHELWLKELEARDQEEQELRRMRTRMMEARVAEKQKQSESERMAIEEKNGFGKNRSVLEGSERRLGVLDAARALWERRQ